MNKDLHEIKDTAVLLSTDREFWEIINVVIDNPKFSTWWGGLSGQHHDFNGGLVRHTKEVIELCFKTNETLNLNLDKKELFFAALFHDVGKMFDYQKNSKYGSIYFAENGEELDEQEPEFIATPHKRIIHHISRSALIWSHAVADHPEFSDKYHDLVLHSILAHHGSREWGSPVAPKTQTAWLLHLCDNMSARMNDCDRLDLVYGKPKGNI